MSYIDKILDKDQVLHEIHDTTGRTKIEGASLVIPEGEAPHRDPVFTDPETGKEYYEKQEFNLEEIGEADDANYDLLTGENIESSVFPALSKSTFVTSQENTAIILSITSNATPGYYYLILNGERQSYISRAFTVVDTQEAVTDITKICLPDCADYYGFLSEDGKTFISYFNLKPVDPTPITSVKQGNTVIPIGSESGTKLYLHTISYDNGAAIFVKYISTYAEALTVNTNVKDKFFVVENGKVEILSQGPTWLITEYSMSMSYDPSTGAYLLQGFTKTVVSLVDGTKQSESTITVFTDTVTAL